MARSGVEKRTTLEHTRVVTYAVTHTALHTPHEDTSAIQRLAVTVRSILAAVPCMDFMCRQLASLPLFGL